jgi:hypothetical protein
MLTRQLLYRWSYNSKKLYLQSHSIQQAEEEGQRLLSENGFVDGLLQSLYSPVWVHAGQSVNIVGASTEL